MKLAGEEQHEGVQMRAGRDHRVGSRQVREVSAKLSTGTYPIFRYTQAKIRIADTDNTDCEV